MSAPPLLEPPRDVTAVLDRPDALLIEAARPPHRGQVPRLVGPNLPLPAQPAGSLVDRRQRVRPLVCVHPNHDHLPPSLRWIERRSGSPADGSHSGRLPRSY
jgi:hypothetical protein